MDHALPVISHQQMPWILMRINVLSVSNKKDTCSDYLVCSYLVSPLKVTQKVK